MNILSNIQYFYHIKGILSFTHFRAGLGVNIEATHFTTNRNFWVYRKVLYCLTKSNYSFKCFWKIRNSVKLQSLKGQMNETFELNSDNQMKCMLQRIALYFKILRGLKYLPNGKFLKLINFAWIWANLDTSQKHCEESFNNLQIKEKKFVSP